MSLTKLEDSDGTFCKRTYYRDEEGRLVERLHHSGALHDAVVQENHEAKSDFRRNDGANIRRVASVPVDWMLKWLMEEGVPGWCGPEALDLVINKKLRDPELKKLLTVPDNYGLKRYE